MTLVIIRAMNPFACEQNGLDQLWYLEGVIHIQSKSLP